MPLRSIRSCLALIASLLSLTAHAQQGEPADAGGAVPGKAPEISLPDLGDLRLTVPRPVRAAQAALGLGRQRLALVLGLGTVGSKPVVDSAQRDTQAVAAALRSGGFVVMLREDVTSADLRSSLQEFRTRLQPGGVGFIYATGLGLQLAGRNLLLTREAPLHAGLPHAALVQQLAERAVPVDELVDALLGTVDSPRMLVLDAAYKHPALAALPQAGLAEQRLPPGLMALFGHALGGAQEVPAVAPLPLPVPTDPQQIAATPFARVLVSALLMPRISGPEALRSTRRAIVDATLGQQSPWLSGDTDAREEFAEATLLDGLVPRTPEEVAREAARQGSRLMSRPATAPRAGEPSVAQAQQPAGTPADAQRAPAQAPPAAPAKPTGPTIGNVVGDVVGAAGTAASVAATVASVGAAARAAELTAAASVAGAVVGTAGSTLGSAVALAARGGGGGSSAETARAAAAPAPGATVLAAPPRPPQAAAAAPVPAPAPSTAPSTAPAAAPAPTAAGPTAAPPSTPATPAAAAAAATAAAPGVADPGAATPSAPESRTEAAPEGGERPAYVPRTNPFGYAEGDTFSYQVIDGWKGEVASRYTTAIEEVLDNGQLLANGRQQAMDAQGRATRVTHPDGSISQFEPAEELWWSAPERGQSRDVKFMETFRNASGRRGKTAWEGSSTVRGVRRVVTPAGEFAVTPIESSGWWYRTLANGARESGQWRRTVYYSPQLGHPVAIDIEDADRLGRLLRRDRVELTHAQSARSAP